MLQARAAHQHDRCVFVHGSKDNFSGLESTFMCCSSSLHVASVCPTTYFGGFEKGLAGGGWRQTNRQRPTPSVHQPLFETADYWGCQACRSVFVNFLVKLDLEFDLKFEVSDGKNLAKFWGRTFLPARKFRGKFRREFRGKFRKLRFKFRDFFRKLQKQKQKGSTDNSCISTTFRV